MIALIAWTIAIIENIGPNLNLWWSAFYLALWSWDLFNLVSSMKIKKNTIFLAHTDSQRVDEQANRFNSIQVTNTSSSWMGLFLTTFLFRASPYNRPPPPPFRSLTWSHYILNMIFYQYGRQCFYKYYYKSCKAKFILRKEYNFYIFKRTSSNLYAQEISYMAPE